MTSEAPAAGSRDSNGYPSLEDVLIDDEVTAEAVSRAGIAVAQVDLATLRVTAISEPAAALLAASTQDVVGHSINDFVDGEPTGALPLLATGRLDGFEAPRLLRRTDGEVVEAYVWAHVLGETRPARYGAVVVTTELTRTTGMLTAAAADQKVIGTVDQEWRIDRISRDVEEMLGYRAVDLAGASLLWPSIRASFPSS